MDELREATKPELKLRGSSPQTRTVEIYTHVSKRNIAAVDSPLDDLTAVEEEKSQESDCSFPQRVGLPKQGSDNRLQQRDYRTIVRR